MPRLFGNARVGILAAALAVAAVIGAGAATGQLRGNVGDQAANCTGLTLMTGVGCAEPTRTPVPTAQPTPTPAAPTAWVVGTQNSGLPLTSHVADVATVKPTNFTAVSIAAGPNTAAAFFAEPNFKGTCVHLSSNQTAPLPTTAGGQARVASVLVGPPGAVRCAGLVLYDGVNHQGEWFYSPQPYLDLPASFQRRASSVRPIGVVDPYSPLVLHSGAGGTGRCSKVFADVPNLAALGVGDNQAMSVANSGCGIRVGPDEALTLSAGPNFDGPSVYVESDIPDLAAIPFDNKAQSLRYYLGPWMALALYSEPNFKGECSVITSQAAQLGQFAVGAQKVSSLKFDTTCYTPDQLTGDVGSFSRPGSDTVTHFGRASDNTLYHRQFQDGRWLPAQSLGGGITHQPAVASWGGDRLDAFARGADGALWQRYYENGTWSVWYRLSASGDLTSAPAAVSWGSGRYDIFARGRTGGLLHVYWDDAGWHTEDMGGSLLGAPTVTSRGPWKLDVFYRTLVDGKVQLHHKAFDNSGWRAPVQISLAEPLHADERSGPAVASWSSNRLDVFARGADDKLWHTAFDNGVWTPDPVGYLGGRLTSGPSASTRGAGKLDVFVRTADVGGVVSQRSYDSQWLPWKAVS